MEFGVEGKAPSVPQKQKRVYLKIKKKIHTRTHKYKSSMSSQQPDSIRSSTTKSTQTTNENDHDGRQPVDCVEVGALSEEVGGTERGGGEGVLQALQQGQGGCLLLRSL